MIEIPLPRVLDSSLNFVKTVRPIQMSVSLNIVPLSYASMRLPKGETLPARGFVELFTSMGSVGVYRVRSPQDAYGNDITSAELEHAIVEVGDYLVLDEYNEMMSATSAIQTIFSHYRGNKWRLGTVSALGTSQVAVQVDHDRVLEAMIAILDQKPECMMSFDFGTTPWTINIVSRGTTVTAEGRLSRNVNSAKISYDDTELVTRCYYEYSTTNSDGVPSTAWAYVDTSTKAQYGLVERVAPATGNYTQSEATAAAIAYSEKHKNPRVSVTISAEELSSITGEAFDTFTIGKLYRLALLDYNVTVEKVVTGLEWENVFDAPEDIIVTLEEEEDTTITFLHDLDAKGGAGGGGGNAKKQDDVWKEFTTQFYRDDYVIDLWARKSDKADNILQQAGMEINSEGVLVYALDNENNVGSKLKVNADAITAEVQRATSEEGTLSTRITQTAEAITLKVSKGDVATQLAVEAGNVSITGGNLTIDGYVTASQLSTTNARITNLLNGTTVADELRATSARLGNSSGGVVYIYGQQVRVYTVEDTSGNTHHVFGYT